MSNVQTPKHVPERGCYKRRTSIEDCIAALTIYDRVEYVSATVTQGVFTHVCSWTEFNKEFEPSKLDYAKTHAMLVRRAERSGATDRAQELLKSLDPARKPPEGEVEMATKKAGGSSRNGRDSAGRRLLPAWPFRLRKEHHPARDWRL